MKNGALVAVLATLAVAPSLALAETQASDECHYRASFNCAKADDAQSRAICSNHELMTADCAMGYAYRDARALPGANPNERLRKEQRKWVASRDAACAGRSEAALMACLGSATEKRLRWLIEHYKLPVTGKIYEPYKDAKPSSPK